MLLQGLVDLPKLFLGRILFAVGCLVQQLKWRLAAIFKGSISLRQAGPEPFFPVFKRIAFACLCMHQAQHSMAKFW